MKKTIHIILALFAVAFITGCAGTSPKAHFTRPLAAGTKVCAGDYVTAKVTAAPGVPALSHDCTRIEGQIVAKVAGAASSSEHPLRNYTVEVTLTRYDKGNAFARGMLAGLGQIHIDGSARLYELPSRRLLAEFTASKTFAWGGAYGMAVRIEDIEETFADIIANAVAGK